MHCRFRVLCLQGGASQKLHASAFLLAKLKVTLFPALLNWFERQGRNCMKCNHQQRRGSGCIILSGCNANKLCKTVNICVTIFMLFYYYYFFVFTFSLLPFLLGRPLCLSPSHGTKWHWHVEESSSSSADKGCRCHTDNYAQCLRGTAVKQLAANSSVSVSRCSKYPWS